MALPFRQKSTTIKNNNNMTTKFNEKEYKAEVRESFINVLNSDTLKFGTTNDKNQKYGAIIRADNYKPGASFCENIDSLCCEANICGYRDVVVNGRKKRCGVLMVGKHEVLLDYESLTQRLYPYTGVYGDDAYKSVDKSVYIKTTIRGTQKSLIEIFEDDAMLGEKVLLRHSFACYNERGEKVNAFILDALWSEYEEEYPLRDKLEFPIFHDKTLDVGEEDNEEYDDEEEPYDDEGDFYEDIDSEDVEGNILSESEEWERLVMKYALVESQVIAFEYIVKYPTAAAAIPCNVYMEDGTFIGQEYGQRQAEIVAEVFKEYKKYFENRLHELKRYHSNAGFLATPYSDVLDF